MWPNAKVSVMGPDQLSSVMQSVSGKKAKAESAGEDRWKELRSKIEHQSTALYASARIWDDGIIAPSETRDVLGLGLELAAEERASRENGGQGGARGEIGADGDAGGWGVFRM